MTPSQQAPLLVERLYELSAWLSEHNIDMQMPVGMIDPAEAAARITELEEALNHWKANHADVTAKKRRQEDVVREALARAERAEAQCRVLEAAAREACDLLAERTYGSPARSPGHNARLRLEAALSLSGGGGAGEFAENANQGLPESPSADAGPYPRSHDDQHSDGGRG